MALPKIFIDGEAGTTGLEIVRRLQSRRDIDLMSIPNALRKNEVERKKYLNQADLVILCLPDHAAKEAVALVEGSKTKILDASTAHRTHAEWVYGFPELSKEQGRRISLAHRVSNPGCYATGALALIRPLISQEVVPPSYAITINAISGYSGGGKELIEICEGKDTMGKGRGGAFCLYGLDQRHKHLPEIRAHGGLDEDPIFLPSYSAAFYRGMLVEIPLRLKGLKRLTGTHITGDSVQDALREHYRTCKFILVDPLKTTVETKGVLSPLDQNETNNIQIRLFYNEEKEILIMTAVLDNLGKGASGAAVQNMELMLGLAPQIENNV